MGEILVKRFAKTPTHQNTLREYSSEVEEARYHNVLDRMSHTLPRDKVCYIFGMGKHPQSTYRKLASLSGTEVVWHGSLLPSYMMILRPFIASYEGVVRIFDTTKLEEVFISLSKMSMVGLYIFDSSLEDLFVETIKNKKYSVYADEVVKQDKGYFIYQVDTDSVESSTGIFEIVSYGVDCSKELVGTLD